MSGTYDLLALHSGSQPQEPSKYFGLSIIVHGALAVAALLMTVPMMDKIKKEVVTIEIQETQPPIPEVKVLAPPIAPSGEVVKPTRGAEKLRSPRPSAPVESAIAETVKGPVATSKKSASHAAKLKTYSGGATAKSAPIAKSAPSRAGVPETIEDIAAPDLNFDGVVAAQAGKLGDDELEDDFKNVDKSNAAAIQAQRAELDNETKQIADEKDEALQTLENENKAQARAMENALEATRTKNAAALAQVKAAEQAAREKAARENELAKQARANALAAKSQGQSADGGKGADAFGANGASQTSSGEPNGVRSLEELRQVPGNPKPQYSVEERMQRQQGLVAFHAYITKSGQPSQFRLTQSTGYRNLDGKTLAALKKWKFYPGQEGWVEIPFKWDIKGGVQEIPTLLRRSRYGSN